MISCNINPRECDDKKISSIQTDTIIETDANTRRIEILDIKKFQLFADTILSDIKGKPSSFKVITDTVFFNEMPDFEKNKTIQGFITRKSEATFKHQFKLSSPNEVLSLTLYEAEFNSKETLDSVFTYLKYLANEDAVGAQEIPYAPGLSYENDYVTRSERHLLWLNSKCPYSFKNHLRYAKALRESLNNVTMIDSIVCSCGAVDCK